MHTSNLVSVNAAIIDLPRVFGIVTRRYRQRLGLSQEEFAILCQLHRTYIGAIERGERSVTIVTAYKIAVALGLSLSALIREVEEDYYENKRTAEIGETR